MSQVESNINRSRHRPTRLRRTGTISPFFLLLQFFDPTSSSQNRGLKISTEKSPSLTSWTLLAIMSGCTFSSLMLTGQPLNRVPIPGMSTILPKVIEIERYQLADYARVDYAITKGVDEIATLEELRLRPNELRRKTSVVRDRTVLAVREVRNNMAKRAITVKNMQESLVKSLRQRSRFAAEDTVDASLRARCFASLECIPTLTLICHFIDAIKAGDFARAESTRFEFQTREDRHEYVVTSRSIFAQFAPSEPADILKRVAKICRASEMANARVIDLFRRCSDPIFIFHRVEPTDQGPDRFRAFDASLLGARPVASDEHPPPWACASTRDADTASRPPCREKSPARPEKFCTRPGWTAISVAMTERL
jgi:hypothetical protein